MGHRHCCAPICCLQLCSHSVQVHLVQPLECLALVPGHHLALAEVHALAGLLLDLPEGREVRRDVEEVVEHSATVAAERRERRETQELLQVRVGRGDSALGLGLCVRR